MRRINAAGLSLVKKWEGLRLKTYKDSAGIETVGYGHTGPDVKAGWTITEEEAERLLRADLATAESAVSRFVTVPLTDNQFAALVAFTFNVGSEAFRRSTLRKRLNAGDYAAVPGQLRLWVHAGGRKLQGLVNRRNAEIELWGTPDAPSKPVGVDPRPGDPAEPPAPVPAAVGKDHAIAAVIGAAISALAIAAATFAGDVWHSIIGALS